MVDGVVEIERVGDAHFIEQRLAQMLDVDASATRDG